MEPKNVQLGTTRVMVGYVQLEPNQPVQENTISVIINAPGRPQDARNVRRMRLISSIVENALSAEGIQVEYDDFHPGAYRMEGKQTYGSEGELTSERMMDIAFAALRKVKARMTTGEDIDQALTAIDQEYNLTGFGQSNDGDGEDELDDERPVRRRPHDDDDPPDDALPVGRSFVGRRDESRMGEPISLRDQLAVVFERRISFICGSPSAKPEHGERIRIGIFLADKVLELAAENRTEETLLPLIEVFFTKFCETYGIKKIVQGEDKTEGFVKWQAGEAMEVIRDILAAAQQSGPDDRERGSGSGGPGR